MSGMDFTGTQMIWRPQLIRLTQIPNPDTDQGESKSCFVNPECITRIARTTTSWKKRDGSGDHPAQDCTVVMLNGDCVFVTESTETVARLRNEAFGFKDSPVNVDNTLRSV